MTTEREIFEVNIPYKFTFPISKAEERDGGLYLIGMATGPEVDSQNERVHPSLIAKWANQINSGEIQVPYRDWHHRDSSLEDLGHVTKAWVDDTNHLGVEVKLDEDHPTARYIHKKAMDGKKYGMSVFGKVISFADEIVDAAQAKVRTFYDATLEEVSNTTRPIYTPSFGTVLSKAVTSAAEGDIRLGEEVKTSQTTTEETTSTVSEVAPKTTTDSGAATAPDTGNAPTNGDDTAAVEGATVEKAVTAGTKKDQKALDAIVKTYNALGSQLKAAGLVADEDANAEGATAETTVEKSQSAPETTTSAPDVQVLSKAVSDLTNIVAALATRIPESSSPGLLSKSAEVDPLDELRSVEDPIERLRLSLAVKHGEAQR